MSLKRQFLLKRQVVSLPPPGPPVIADVRVEDVVAENRSANGAALSSGSTNAYDQL